MSCQAGYANISVIHCNIYLKGNKYFDVEYNWQEDIGFPSELNYICEFDLLKMLLILMRS